MFSALFTREVRINLFARTSLRVSTHLCRQVRFTFAGSVAVHAIDSVTGGPSSLDTCGSTGSTIRSSRRDGNSGSEIGRIMLSSGSMTSQCERHLLLLGGPGNSGEIGETIGPGSNVGVTSSITSGGDGEILRKSFSAPTLCTCLVSHPM